MTKASPHIAIIDDEEPIRKALMRLMRSVGLSVETFASGPEFLKSIETRLPDCVVLDLHMPHMNGFNVQAHLAQKYAALPVIIITGHDLPQARERAMAGGASAFLRKPVTTALFSTPFLPRRRLLTQEVSTANEFPQGKQTNSA